MKQKIYLSAFILLLAVFVGCQQDEIVPIEPTPSVQRLVVTAEDIPGVTSTLLKKMGAQDAFTQFSVNDGETDSRFDIDWGEIKQLIDSVGRETYAFRLHVEDDNPATFYNLILKFSENHEAHQPFILKYKMSDTFLSQFIETGSLEGFKGTVQKILINESSTGGDRRGNAALDPGGVSLGDPCPSETPISGNPGGGGPSPVDNPGFTWECTTFMTTTTWYSKACDPSGCSDPIVIGVDYSYQTECGLAVDGGAAEDADNCAPDPGEIPILTPIEDGPDCDSFNYTKITNDAYWQEAAVKGIYFNVVILEPGTGRLLKRYTRIQYNEPIWFGLPTKFSNDYELTSGQAATISARHLNQVMSETADHFYMTRASVSEVKAFFRKRMETTFREYGGRINFNYQNGSPTVTPTTYETRIWGTGNCR